MSARQENVEAVLDELVQLVRGVRPSPMPFLGDEPEWVGFVEITLSHGLTARLLTAQLVSAEPRLGLEPQAEASNPKGF